MLRALLVLAATLVWAVPGLAAETDDVARWQQSPRAFDPAAVNPGVRQVAKGGTVFEAPLRWMKSLRLQSDVAITLAGNAVTLPSGTQLPFVVFTTKAQPTTARQAYCTRFGLIHTKSAFISDPWLFQAPFNAKGKQLCLEDSDRDGVLDRSFVRTIQHIMGRPDIIYTGPVSHTATGANTFDPIDGGTDTLKFVVKGISKTKVQAWIEITALGGLMNFTRLQTGGYDLSALHEFRQPGVPSDILGLEVRLTGFDVVAKTSEFDLRAAGNRGPIIIPDFVAAY
jgi:hypothetical protein